MKRRQFIALTSSVAAWPLAARGQQSAKLPTIGFMGSGTATAQRQWTAAFVRRQVSSVGPRAARSLSSTAGRKDAAIALPKSPPSSPA